MKKRLLALTLAGCLTLSGCAPLLDREYISVTPHNVTKTDEGTSSVLRVETYQELVNSLIYYVSSGAEEGGIRLYMDSALVEQNLRDARTEVLQEYPLAAYAVENITFDHTPLVTYTEARVEFTYRRTQQQMNSIVSTVGITAIRSELTRALESYADECVLRINYFDQGADYIRSLIRDSYYAAPTAALEFPELEITLYPETGRQRIAEIRFRYQTDPALLSERAVLLKQAAARMALELSGSDSADRTLRDLAAALLSDGGYDEAGGSSAYDALLGSGANAEGIALAAAAVCEELELDCRVARGFLNDVPHFWNIVETDSGWRHLDLSRYDSATPFRTDADWREAGYLWNETALPTAE